MSKSTIDAKEQSKVASCEREQTRVELWIGVFFDDSHSGGMGAKYSKMYRPGYKKEAERAYAFNWSVANQDFIYVWKDGDIIIQDTGRRDLLFEAGVAVKVILSSIVNLIMGYSHYDEVELKFDIYGIDNGVIAAYALSHIVEPKEDGFDEDDKSIIFSQIDKTYLSAFQSLKHKRYVNHLEILNTKKAQRIEAEQTSFNSDNSNENDGYCFSVGVTKNHNQSSRLPRQQGFNKDDINQFLDDLQATLDVAGMVDVFGIGTVADAINVIISLGRGQWGAAALSLLAIIPIIGNLATAAKSAKHIKPVAKIVSDSTPAAKSTKKIDKVADNAVSNQKATDNVCDMNAYREAKNMPENVTSMSQYRQAKDMEGNMLKTGTDGTVYNSVGGVGGPGGYKSGYSYSYNRTNYRQTSSNSPSIFSEGNPNKVEATAEIYEMNPHAKVGAKDHGQEHGKGIVDQVLEYFKWNRNSAKIE